MPKKSGVNIALFAALTLLSFTIIAIEYYAMRNTDGTFMYPLDDTFIHMVLAKNLGFHGNWGINQYEFGSASSSILYTLILTVSFLVFSAHIAIPFIINCIAGVLLVISIDKWLRKQDLDHLPRLVILAAMILFTPLPLLIVSGMEHTLQCLFSFLFIFGFSEWLEERRRSPDTSWKIPVRLYVYGLLVTGIRYEGMFVVAIACLILLYYRRIAAAFRLGIVSLTPLILFGIYSIWKGSYFFPNSVLLKSESLPLSIQGISKYMIKLVTQKLTVINFVTGIRGFNPGISLLATHQLLIVLPLAYFLFRKNIVQNKSYAYILVLTGLGTLLHLSFASTGWLCRYEAYLFLCSILIVTVLIFKYGKELFADSIPGAKLIAVIILFVLSLPLIYRVKIGYTEISRACINIYEQQYQMARFMQKYYPNDVIAMNDIGAICYFTSGKNLDLWGLGSIDVARSKKEKYNTAAFLDSVARRSGVKVAVVYDSWFGDSVVHRWQKVATWQIKNNVICGDTIVSFYAIDPSTRETLKSRLEAFTPALPATVTVKQY